MAAGKAASAIVKGLSKILRDVKSKPSTTSGKRYRKNNPIIGSQGNRPSTKTAVKQNITQRPDKTLATEGTGGTAQTSKTQQAIVRVTPKGRPGGGQRKTVTGQDGKLSKTAAAAEKRVKARELRRAATKAGVGAAGAGIASIPILMKDDKSATASEPPKTSKSEKTSKSYKVKKGDTLSEIARDNGTTLKKLKAANPQIKDLNKIRPGQSIKIPMPKMKDRKSVYQDMSKSEMKKISKQKGGNLKSVEAQKNPGLSKLPTNVRNRMGYAKSGGKVYKRKEGGQVMSGNDLVSSIYN
tara:strand:- start:78 stop:968 length:891 start_codon:yes stop_codon:yes gene_type:complete